jgi:hypothetical protein
MAGVTEPFTILAQDLTKNYLAMTQGLQEGTAYTWRVVAMDGQGGSTKSTSVWSFITAENGVANNAPAPFDLFSPVDGDQNVPLSPTLTWEQAVDPDGDPVTYDVYLEDINFSPGQISSMNPNLFTIPLSLNYNTEYLWEVIAYDNKGFWTLSTSVFYFKTVEEPEPITMSLHTANSPLQSEGRYGHQNVVHNGELYTVGGFVLDAIGGGDRNDVWKTSDAINWTMVRAHDVEDLNAPHPSSESQVLSYGGLLYVFNGERNTIQTSSDGAVWEQVAWEGNVLEGTHYPPLQGHQVIEFQGNLYVIGGSSGGQVKNDVWVSYDFGITWTEVSDHNFPARRDHQVVVLGNTLWLMGGVGGGLRMNDVWTSDDGMNWTQEPDAGWSPRSNLQCTVFNDIMYVSGGDVGGDSDEIWYYRAFDFTWVQVAPATGYGPRESHHSVVFNDKLYIDMGKNGALPINDTWIIE